MVKEIKIKPIGNAKVDETQGKYQIKVNEQYKSALKELDNFTHAMAEK